MVGLPTSVIREMPIGPDSRAPGREPRPCVAFRSAPEQNALSPAPVSTSTSSEESRLKESTASKRPWAVSASTQLRTSGRLMVTTSVWSRRSVRTLDIDGGLTADVGHLDPRQPRSRLGPQLGVAIAAPGPYLRQEGGDLLVGLPGAKQRAEVVTG